MGVLRRRSLMAGSWYSLTAITGGARRLAAKYAGTPNLALSGHRPARGCHRLPAAPRCDRRVKLAEPLQCGQRFDSSGGR